VYICSIKKNSEVSDLKSRLSNAVEDTTETLNILKEMLNCDQIELLFYDKKNFSLKDISNGHTTNTKYLSNKSLLGSCFLTHKSFVKNDVINDKNYDIALDNPYKIKMTSQLLLCLLIDKRVLGIIRLSNHEKFSKLFIDRIRLFSHSFKDIFLNELYKEQNTTQKPAFSSKTTEVYVTLKKIKDLYKNLLKYTDHPEVKKLISNGDENVDTILEYVNPNIDNVSRVKKNLNNLRKINRTNTDNIKIRILIADDVKMNVKILNAMLMNEEIEDIQFAYDGIETLSKMLSSYKSTKYINVLFLDHHMPGKLGVEIAEELKLKEERLFIVSITNDPDAIADKQNLYDYHISKPFIKECVHNVFTQIQEKFQHMHA